MARAGFTPVWANDVDPYAIATHRRLHEVADPDWRIAAQRFAEHAAVAGDIRDVGGALRQGMADVVVGGPPCQGFSVAGRMDPNDPRSRHVFDFLGLVARIKPRAFVMENVAALARNKRWSDVIASLRETAAPNYRVSLVVLNASHWGVPQKRERMFLIGVPLEGPEISFPCPPTASAPPTVRNALKTLPPAGEAGNEQLCTAIISLAKNPVLRRSPYAGMLFNGQGRVMNLDQPAPTLPASMGGGIGRQSSMRGSSRTERSRGSSRITIAFFMSVFHRWTGCRKVHICAASPWRRLPRFRRFHEMSLGRENSPLDSGKLETPYPRSSDTMLLPLLAQP